MSVLVLVLAVSAACCLGFGFVLQQNAASHAPLSDFLSPRILLDLIRVPRWLGGIGLMVCGMVLGAIALGNGEVSLVEPLLATNLLFALALSRHQTKQPLGKQGWAGLLLLMRRCLGVHRGRAATGRRRRRRPAAALADHRDRGRARRAAHHLCETVPAERRTRAARHRQPACCTASRTRSPGSAASGSVPTGWPSCSPAGSRTRCSSSA